MIKECKHKYKVKYYSGKEITSKCTKCNTTLVTQIPESEKKKVMGDLFDVPPEKNVHLVWFDFKKEFFDPTGKWDINDIWRNIDNWVKKWPKDVTFLSCDDEMFMGARIILITHQCKRNYMGTTLVYITQTGHFSQLFLYPGHMSELIKALVRITNGSKPRMKKNQIDCTKHSKYIHDLVLKLNK